MSSSPEPPVEAARIKALERYGILDTLPEAAFDRIARLAVRLLRAPIAIVSFIDRERQWIKASYHFEAREIDLRDSFCFHTIAASDVLVIPDATRDSRFAGNRFVTGPDAIRFYAGAPLITAEGLRLGTVCVLDRIPRPEGLTGEEELDLRELAALTMSELDLRAERVAASQAMNKLRLSESMVWNTSDGMMVTEGEPIQSPGPRILYINEAFTRLTGYSAEEVVGRNPRFLQGPATDRGELDRIRTALKNRTPVRAELINYRKDGSEYWVEATIIPVVNENGEVANWIGLHRDTTGRRKREEERLRTETALRDLNETLQALLQAAPVPIFALDLDGIVKFWNPAAGRTFGWTEAEALGKRLPIVPDDRQEDFMNLLRIARSGKSLSEVERLRRRKDGSEIWISIWTAPVRNAEGAVERIVSVIIDTSEQKEAQRALQESEERYRMLFENNPKPVWVFEVETLKFLAVNQAAVNVYGYSRSEFLNMTLADIRPPEDVPQLVANLKRPDRKPGPPVIRRHRKKDGSIMFVEITSRPVGFMGRPCELVLAVDITEKKLLEEQLRQSQKMEAIGQLAGGIAHDFNNLLTVVNGYAALILNRMQRDNPHYEFINSIKSAGDKAASLTQKLLALSRRQVLQPRVIRLNEVVTGIQPVLQRLIPENIELSVMLNPNLRLVRADPAQIEQVILNLAINARDAMPGGGRLTIETRNALLDESYTRNHADVAPGEYAMLALSDNGSGMDPAVQSHIFEPFFTTKDRSKGTGMGLPTVYGIVKQSGGHIWVYSERGIGTTFKVYLPLTEQTPQTAARPTAQEVRACGHETVLLVEDNENVRALAGAVLRSNGYTVLEAADGQEALRICERYHHDIHLLLTDVVLPKISGRQVSEQVLSRRSTIKVLFISGYSENAITLQGVLEPGLHFLAKPFTPEELVVKVRELLDQT